MEKFFWIQIEENCPINMAGKGLDIRFFISNGLSKKQVKELDEEIQYAITEYGEANDGDYAELDYYSIIESVTEKLNIKYEYPQVDYTIYV